LSLESGKLEDALAAMTLIKSHLSNKNIYETNTPIDFGFEYRHYLKMNAYNEKVERCMSLEFICTSG
jgi:hypothetical protein